MSFARDRRQGRRRRDAGDRGARATTAALIAAGATLAALTLTPAWHVANAQSAPDVAPLAPPVPAPAPVQVVNEPRTGAAGNPRAPATGNAPPAAALKLDAAGAAQALATAAVARAPRPSPVYAPPSLPLTFDHARHARAGIDCQRCHKTAAGSVLASDNLLPAESACRPCHEIDRKQPEKVVPPGQPVARCDGCHPGFSGVPRPGALLAEPARLVMPPPDLKFNHRLHVQRGMACALCHAGVDAMGAGTLSELPRMASCLACHDGRQASARCTACHPTLADGRLRTELGGGTLVPSGSLRGVDAHTPAFRTDHRIAGRDERYCAQCHKQRECLDCHAAGVVRPSDFHPVDYASLHAVDAKRNVPDCSSCHRNQTFCVGCHQRTGVASDPEGGQAGRQPRNPFGTGTRIKEFHPPGWARDESGAPITTPRPNSHSVQARRNLRSCTSCHREETCLACHSADLGRSPGFTPHAPGFAGSATCRALAQKNGRACLKCHFPDAPELSCQ